MGFSDLVEGIPDPESEPVYKIGGQKTINKNNMVDNILNDDEWGIFGG